jgi:hypothetical protein
MIACDKYGQVGGGNVSMGVKKCLSDGKCGVEIAEHVELPLLAINGDVKLLDTL